ncbi:MAG: hypothetical protein K2L34_04730, partial [Muribaculaceae bacterium]|nr:hypothetical protein [Muribaculaceae bacterium]
MKTKITNKLFLALSLLTLAGCAGDELTRDLYTPGDGAAVFNITTEASQIGVITRADGEEAEPTISELKWAVADSKGNILSHYYGRVNDQNNQITIEGLTYGDYSLLCLATLNEAEGITFSNPDTLEDEWLVNDKKDDPVDGIYCYKKVPFTLGANGINTNVILEHVAALVSVDLNVSHVSQWRHIKKVSVTFNEEIPTSLDAGGTYSGAHIVDSYNIYQPTGVFNFTTFPSDQPVSGYVEIESSRDNGEDFVQTYDFSDLQLEAGKIAHINLDYRHPEQESGLLYVAAKEQWRFDLGTMFLNDEPRSTFYNNQERWFYTCAPLQIWIRDDGKLAVRYYS